jgi:hypothetical protein
MCYKKMAILRIVDKIMSIHQKGVDTLKKAFCVILGMVLSLMLVTAVFAESGKMNLKVGDEVYVCNCGPSCPCNTMSTRAGDCTCGNKMVKAKVTKVEKDVAYVQAEGWQKPAAFRTQGKYMCACDPSCTCNTISQNPGKCVCGKEMKPVK